MSVYYVGIDVSKRTLDVYLEVQGKSRHRQFGNAPSGFKDLIIWIKKQKVKKFNFCINRFNTYFWKLPSLLIDFSDRII